MAESPSWDPVALNRCAEVLAGLGERLLGKPPERRTIGTHAHLVWTFGAPRVLLIGHFDTVWDSGTTQRWPFSVDGDVATGPGVFDMKAGIVQGLYAVASLQERDGVCLVFTSDEETGSATGRLVISSVATAATAALVLEPSLAGALKVARKGGSKYTLEFEGRAAHAGLEPERGVNALEELALQVPRLRALARPDLGTSVTPTVAQAGTASNVVPARARLMLDVRARSRHEQERVDAAVRALDPLISGARVRVTGGINRPPLERSASGGLFERAQAIAARLALPPLEAAEVGGGSDGNFTAADGIPTLDGLGAVGAGAHAEGEHVSIAAMPQRAALVAELVEDLQRNPPSRLTASVGSSR